MTNQLQVLGTQTFISDLMLDLTGDRIKSNTDAITAINDETNGVVATAKNYADELNSAMDARIEALETTSTPVATEEEIRALWTKDNTESE